MKAKQTFKVILFIVLFLGVVSYVSYAMVDMRDGNPKEVCTEVSLVVEDNPHAAFIDKAQVEDLLVQAQLYPKGKLMALVDTRQIEQTLKANSFIDRVECYKTTNGMEVGTGKVCIRVTQRTPVIYVLPDNGEGYYLDADGKVIENTAYANNLLTATGNIDLAYASEALAAFGEYVQDNPYWDDLIEQVYVAVDAKGRHSVTLVPRVGDCTILMGDLDQYEKKLRRLKVFYEKGLTKVGWNKYGTLNLAFDNQVVCTKR